METAGLRYGFAEGADARLHYQAIGTQGRPFVLCLHGFPEYAGAWSGLQARLSDRFHVVAPNQRGYYCSDKPPAPEAYRPRRLVEDVRAFAETFVGRAPFLLVGHDWGGAVAWAFALRYPERLKGLVIVNAAHPGVFQRLLAAAPDQQKASAYIARLQGPDAEAWLSAQDFGWLESRFSGLAARGLFTASHRAAYRAAWSQPGALTGMANWYRAMKLAPAPSVAPAPYADAALTVRVPTRVLWGLKDEALLPACLDGLSDFVPDLEVTRFAEGTHWLVHEETDALAAAVAAFADRLDGIKTTAGGS